MINFTHREMTEEQWLNVRRFRVGSSDVACLFDCSPYKSRWTLWHVLAGKLVEPPLEDEHIFWGRQLQEATITGALRRGVIQRVLYCQLDESYDYIDHPTVPGMGFTPDGVALYEGRNVLLEVKHTRDVHFRRLWAGAPLTHILLQGQHQLACVPEIEAVLYLVLVGGQRLELFVDERRPNIIAEIERRVSALWASISANQPPPVDGHSSTGQALNELIMPASDAVRIDDMDLNDLCDAYIVAKNKIAEAGAHQAELRNRIIEMTQHRVTFCYDHRIDLVKTSARAEWTISGEDVGKVIPGRAGGLRLSIRREQWP